MTTLTPDQLAELARLEAAITKGPWHVDKRFLGSIEDSRDIQIAGTYMMAVETLEERNANAAFIAAIRNAAKPLIEEVKELRRREVMAVDKLDRQLTEIADLRRQLAEKDAELAESNRLKDIFMKDASAANGILERMKRGA
jgi:hypothetical protein